MANYYRHFMPQEDTKSISREVGDKLSKAFELESDQLKKKLVTEVEEPVPLVCKSSKELGKAKKISLRTAAQTTTSKVVELKQFDPNFFSRANIWCRYPGCKQRRSREYNFDGRKPKKEDLYLCASHRKNLEDYIEKMCAEKGVDISSKNWRRKDLEDYTSMIGLLESGLCSSTTKSVATINPWSSSKHPDLLLQEVCLNMRNYLIIVNVLLNPDEKNLVTALTGPMTIFLKIVEIIKDDKLKDNTKEYIEMMKDIIKFTFCGYGIVYKWIKLHTSMGENPNTQIGAGIGGFIGLIGFGAGPAVGAITTAGGAVFGGVIGTGVGGLRKKLISSKQHKGDEDEKILRVYQEFAKATTIETGFNVQPQEQQPTEEEKAVYCVTGTAKGDLDLAVVSGSQAAV